MLIKKNIKNNKRGNESRRVREQEESNLEEDEKDLDNYKKGISSEENNNANSSIDIEKLKIDKKEEKPKKKKSKNKLNEMDNALLQLEQKNKEKLINGELYDLLQEIEDENKDFKKNVFFSNFHELNNNLGIFDDISQDNKNTINDNYVGVKGEITSHGLIDKYTEKAEDLKKNKKKKKK
jgi:hypothetical protein